MRTRPLGLRVREGFCATVMEAFIAVLQANCGGSQAGLVFPAPRRPLCYYDCIIAVFLLPVAKSGAQRENNFRSMFSVLLTAPQPLGKRVVWPDLVNA